MKKWNFDTIAIHGGFDWEESLQYNSIVVPIIQSAVYPLKSAEYAADLFSHKAEGFFYGRIDNPTVAVFEKRMAALEGAEAGLGTASGLAALFMIVHHLVKAGDEIVSSNQVYGGTFQLFEVSMLKMGVKVRWVIEPDKISAWEKAITPKTRLLYVESPSNPLLFVGDIPALTELAHSKGIPLVVDNTICTPALMRPLELGADIVFHSSTKYISGNSTSLSGVIVGKKDFINYVRHEGYRNMGPSLSPFNAWLCLLGLESLSLRMERHSSNAMTIARYLEKHPKVTSVNYPGLESHTQHAVAKRQMKAFSSLLSFIIKGELDDACCFIDNLKLCVHATHLGTTKTIAIQPAATTHCQMSPEDRKKAGIEDTTIRISVGLEDHEDLITDIEQALEKV